MYYEMNLQYLLALTSWPSSSERALSIWSNRGPHLARCMSAQARLESSPTVLFMIEESLSLSDENSFDSNKGKSVLITFRTLFLLRCSAAVTEYNRRQNLFYLNKIH